MTIPTLPRKMRRDTIAEALCEIRFSCSEGAQIPELVMGKLAGAQPWTTFNKVRLPISDIPASMRILDPNLKYQPSLELRSPDGLALVKIGESVLSVHRLAPYPGGDAFEIEVQQALNVLFSSLSAMHLVRLGLRYINVFTREEHGVTSVSDLDQSVTVAGSPLVTPVNLNYFKTHGPEHTSLVRIAAPEFVAGPMAKPFTALVDVDVFTPAGFNCSDLEHAKRWLSEARVMEKREFFSLFTQSLREQLIES